MEIRGGGVKAPKSSPLTSTVSVLYLDYSNKKQKTKNKQTTNKQTKQNKAGVGWYLARAHM